ncbi:MAG: N-acyl homoserine lactonase family protein [Haloarculaceae archaeon]
MVDCPMTVVDRGTITADTNAILDGFVTATASEPDPDLQRGEGVVFNLVLDHPEATVLWDTGSHPDAADGHWPVGLYEAFTHEDPRPIEADLDAAGYSVEEIDLVIQSHLHLDHAGGLYAFDGTDVPIVVHEAELKHAYYSAKTDEPDADEAYVLGDFDHDLNWRVVHGRRHTLLEGVELHHLPGHTAGLLGVFVDRDDPVLVAGDQAYVGANYEAGWSMGASLLHSSRDWHESMERCRELERRHGARVLYGHDADQIEALGETF